jgi:hypothetical protein
MPTGNKTTSADAERHQDEVMQAAAQQIAEHEERRKIHSEGIRAAILSVTEAGVDGQGFKSARRVSRMEPDQMQRYLDGFGRALVALGVLSDPPLYLFAQARLDFAAAPAAAAAPAEEEAGPVRRPRGRPRKHPVAAPAAATASEEAPVRRPRGRPRKHPVAAPAERTVVINGPAAAAVAAIDGVLAKGRVGNRSRTTDGDYLA